MKLTLVFATALAAGLLLGAGSQAQTAPDPVNCTGYPEPRIFLENQSWWEPQPGPASHPGTGKQGHIHVGACFPLYQKLSGSTLHLDVNVKLHNIPGTPSKLRFTAYQTNTWIVTPNNALVPACASADCEYWYSFDIPLSDIPYKGWREFSAYLNVAHTDGAGQRNWWRYFAYVDHPSKPDAPIGSAGSTLEDLGGDTWYSPIIGGTTGKYARAEMVRQDVPWDEATGQLKAVSGIWTPTVRFEARKNFVYVDPVLHANPPSHGTVVYEQTTANTGYHIQQLAIDTTQLADGMHRLLIGTSNVASNGTHSGILVVPFLVKNGC